MNENPKLRSLSLEIMEIHAKVVREERAKEIERHNGMKIRKSSSLGVGSFKNFGRQQPDIILETNDSGEKRILGKRGSARDVTDQVDKKLGKRSSSRGDMTDEKKPVLNKKSSRDVLENEKKVSKRGSARELFESGGIPIGLSKRGSSRDVTDSNSDKGVGKRGSARELIDSDKKPTLHKRGSSRDIDTEKSGIFMKKVTTKPKEVPLLDPNFFGSSSTPTKTKKVEYCTASTSESESDNDTGNSSESITIIHKPSKTKQPNQPTKQSHPMMIVTANSRPSYINGSRDPSVSPKQSPKSDAVRDRETSLSPPISPKETGSANLWARLKRSHSHHESSLMRKSNSQSNLKTNVTPASTSQKSLRTVKSELTMPLQSEKKSKSAPETPVEKTPDKTPDKTTPDKTTPDKTPDKTPAKTPPKTPKDGDKQAHLHQHNNNSATPEKSPNLEVSFRSDTNAPNSAFWTTFRQKRQEELSQNNEGIFFVSVFQENKEHQKKPGPVLTIVKHPNP